MEGVEEKHVGSATYLAWSANRKGLERINLLVPGLERLLPHERQRRSDRHALTARQVHKLVTDIDGGNDYVVAVPRLPKQLCDALVPAQ